MKKAPLIAILTPAKSMTTKAIGKKAAWERTTSPRLSKETSLLVRLMKRETRSGVKKLMKVSDKIADLNVNRYRTFEEQIERPAMLYFDGAAHRGFDAWSLENVSKSSAQRRVRIVSGLYGLLRPYDRMKAYRLEMGTKLRVREDAKNLYEFWGTKITDLLLEDLDLARDGPPPVIVNCCSKEYAKAVRFDRLEENGVTVVTCEFPGPSVYAKRARGMMCRFVAEEAIEEIDALKAFAGFEEDAHYVFDEAGSSKKKNTLVFHRRAGPPMPKAKRRRKGD